MTEQHDIRFVLLGLLVCVIAMPAAMTLLHRARHSAGRARLMWGALAAIVCAFGMWATHFIEILAYSPGVPTGENLFLVILSLAAILLFTGAAFDLALNEGGKTGLSHGPRFWPRLGGAILGAGLAVMHYTGIWAVMIAGHMRLDPGAVALSILLGIALSATALPIGMSAHRPQRLAGAMLLSCTVAVHHFVGMSAISIVADPSIVLAAHDNLSISWLVILFAGPSLAIVALAFLLLWADSRERMLRREGERMRSFADAALEGLMILQGDSIVTVNQSFSAMAELRDAELAGAPLSICFPEEGLYARLLAHPGCMYEAELRHRDGSTIAVEIMLRVIDYGGSDHHALAVRDMRDRKTAEEQIRFLADHDALTGLPNLRTFRQSLDRAVEHVRGSDQRLAVFSLKMNRFKDINDIVGHASGDRLLQRLALSFSALLGENRTICRDGHRFAMLVTGVTSVDALGRLAESIIAEIELETEDLPAGLAASGSIGIAICPDDGSDSDTLLSHALSAMEQAKSEGRGIYRFFEAAIGAEVRERRQIEYDLRDATLRHEMRLVYQPQILIETGEIVSFEALLRWRHPIRGEISPGLFIPIAEDCGAIEQIGAWVLRMACAQAAEWQNPLRIAVNVSAIQLHAPGFVALVHAVLIETGLAPGRLELEITETALVRDLSLALKALRQLRALGIHIAMDDFGMGYSSLSNLRAFPFDRIKIDASFTRAVDSNEQAAAIVRAVIGLGRGLKLPVLAEGVETVEELAFLRREGCQEAQGYLIGRPAAIEVFGGAIDGSAPHAVLPAFAPRHADAAALSVA